MERNSVSVDSLSNIHFLHISNHSNNILSGLEELRNDSLFTDAILCAGANEYPCHRAVLASSSPYFKAMFSSPLKESHDNRVSFSDMSNAVLAQIVNFIYTGRVEINNENAQDLLAAASLLQYHEVVEACCDYLKHRLHYSNCLGIEWFSHLHSLHKLEEETHQYVIKNFDRVIESDEFLQLSPERLSRYLEISSIDVTSEEKLYEAAVRWSENGKHADDVLCQIFGLIRFNCMSPDYLTETASKGRHFQNCNHCLNRIKTKEINSNTLIEKQSEKSTQNLLDVFTPRPSTLAKEVIVVLGIITDSGEGTVEAFDPAKERWMRLNEAEVPCTLTGIGIATAGNDIYVTGGIRNEQVISEVWCFLSKGRRWISLPSLQEPRSYHSCTSWNNCLYVIGGLNSFTSERRHAPALETVECLDLSEVFLTLLSPGGSAIEADPYNSILLPFWKVITKIPCPRIGSAAVSIDGAIIEVGGRQYGIPVKKLESYRCFSMPQASNDKIFEHSKVLLEENHLPTFAGGEQFVLPEVIDKSQIVVVDGQLYIFWEESAKFISLNPTKRTFKDLARPCRSVSGGMTVVGDKIYLVGGRTDVGLGPTRVVECYDTVKNSWLETKYYGTVLDKVHCVTIRM